MPDLATVPTWELLEAAADRYRDTLGDAAPHGTSSTEMNLRHQADITKQAHDSAEETITGAALVLYRDDRKHVPEQLIDESLLAGCRRAVRLLHDAGYLRRPEWLGHLEAITWKDTTTTAGGPGSVPPDPAWNKPADLVDAEVDEAPDPDALDTSPTDDPGTWELN